jgi:hypothetical protein
MDIGTIPQLFPTNKTGYSLSLYAYSLIRRAKGHLYSRFGKYFPLPEKTSLFVQLYFTKNPPINM